jgi:hypothetical protein
MTHPQIVDGPNKYELMLALFDRRFDKPRPVTFKVLRRPGYQPIEVLAHIVSVSIEDGSGESWIIELQTEDFSKYHHGYYSTKDRKGVLNPGLRAEAT